jgi:hypothetical protein
MAQAVSHRPLITGTRVRALVIYVIFVVDKAALAQVFSVFFFGFTYHYHSVVALHTRVLPGR